MDKIVKVICKKTCQLDDNFTINNYDNFKNEKYEMLGIDSIKLVDLVTNTCLELEIDLLSFSDDEILNLNTIEDLRIILKNKVNGI